MPYLPENQQTNSFIPSDIVRMLKYVIYADPKELKRQRGREQYSQNREEINKRRCEAYRQKETIVAEINGTQTVKEAQQQQISAMHIHH
jgi:hypothetical protein